MQTDGDLEEQGEYDWLVDQAVSGQARTASENQKVVPAILQDKNAFKPWHMPRKQVVREDQWASECARLLLENDRRTLRYLTLPGDELLDIRELQHSLPARCGFMPTIRFVGINDMQRDEMRTLESDVSEQEVRALEGIDPRSTILHGVFEDLVTDSFVHDSVIKLAPFDVVNLDLTRSVLKGQGVPRYPTLVAIRRILSMQRACQGPWLLFLTTRAVQFSEDNDRADTLRGIIGKNLDTCPEFGSAMTEILDVQDPRTSNPPDGLPTCRLLAVALGKWLTSVMLRVYQGVSVDLRKSYCYAVGKSHLPNMLSLVFEINMPLAFDDPSGLSSERTSGNMDEYSERINALRLAGAAGTLSDLDELLGNDGQIRRRAIEGSSRLLEAARYHGPAIGRWLPTQFIR